MAPTIGILAFIKRKPGVTPEQFHDHWVSVHGPLVKPWAIKHGFLEYRQVHLTAALNTGRAPVGPEAAGAHTALDSFDGCATFSVTSLDGFRAAFADPYYREVIAPDEERFVDRASGVMRVVGELHQVI